MTSHQVSVAGEAYAAYLFAQAGFDVLVQYGANQPVYDFAAMRNQSALKISVKATQLSGWGLIQNYKKGRTYHEAADAWLKDQPNDVLFCLISFFEIQLNYLPRCYLASPKEIANHHKSARKGAGHTTLYEDHTPSRGIGKNHRYKIPDEWKFSSERLAEACARFCGVRVIGNE